MKFGESYIRKNIKWPVNFKTGSIERVEIPEIPLEAVREALINSLIHRDFKNPKSNEIAIYKDRIEIFNPGEFPEGYTPEDFIEGKEGSMPRNPLVANTLYLSKDIEKWGSGFRRITEACEKANAKVKFEIRKNGFMVIFYRKTDEELLDLTGENKNNSANGTENGTQIDTEKLILDILRKTPNITQKELSQKTNVSLRTVKRVMQQLKENNVIERVGSDRKGYWEINE